MHAGSVRGARRWEGSLRNFSWILDDLSFKNPWDRLDQEFFVLIYHRLAFGDARIGVLEFGLGGDALG